MRDNMVKPSETQRLSNDRKSDRYTGKKNMIPSCQSLEIKRIINMIIIPYNKTTEVICMAVRKITPFTLWDQERQL